MENQSLSSGVVVFFVREEISSIRDKTSHDNAAELKIERLCQALNDGRLLANLSVWDVVAQELKYHPTCLIGLYNRERAYLTSIEDEYMPDK